MASDNDMKDLTSNEIKLIIDKSLLEQEQRLNLSFQNSLEKLTDKFATKEQVGNVDKRHTDKNKDQDIAIKALEDWNTWALRIVIGAVILSVLGLVLVNKGSF